MNVTDQEVAALATTARHLMAAKMFSLACCVMLYFDILITFGDEVEKIWKQRFTFATVLWFMNRYLSPLGYVVIIASFHMDWPKSVCNRYVLYPEILKVFTAAAIGVIFILRLYSIYGGSMLVLVSFSVLLVAELVVKIWAFTDGTSVNLPPGLVGCILTGKGDSNERFVFTWVAELAFDSIVFVATLSRTLIIYRRHRQGAAIPLIKIMMRDGIAYFLVIFVANLVTVILFITLPPDLKAVNASFSTLITSLMVSRLILNLRNQAMRPRANVVSYPSSHQIHTDQETQTQDRGITTTVIGNLGQPVENDWFYEGGDDKGEKDFRGGRDDNEDPHDRTRDGDMYAMENLKSQRNQTNTNTSVSTTTGTVVPAFGGQIVVEVTQSVTSDLQVRAREGQAEEEVAPSYYPHAQPPSPPYPYSSYPYAIDGNFRLSRDSHGLDVYATRDQDPNANLSYTHLPALSQSLTDPAAQEGLGAGRTRTLIRPGSARSALSAISSGASHVLHSQSQEHMRRHDDNDTYDEGSSASGHWHVYGHSFHPVAAPGTREREREREARRREAASPESNTSTSSPNTTRKSTRVRQRVNGDGGWRPPPTWMIGDVDVHELGRPRGSGDRGRRPSTS